MVRLWTTLFVVVMACLVAVNTASAQRGQGKRGQKGGRLPDAGKMFDDAEKAVKHDPLTGVLTKEEFVKAMKESGSKLAQRAEQMFDRIKKADSSKVTKEEFTTALKDFMGNRGGNGVPNRGGNGGRTLDGGQLFDSAEKAAKHDPLTGVLTKDEFIKGMKESGSKMADRAEQMFDRINKADCSKVTKDEFTNFLKDFMGNRGRKKQ